VEATSLKQFHDLALVGGRPARRWRRAAQGAELLAKGEILEGEFGVGTECRTQRAEEADEDGEHRVDHARKVHGPAMSPSLFRLRSSPMANLFGG
jgi:hypothetical protein